MTSHQQPAMDNTTAAEEEEESMYNANDMFYSPAEKENLLHIQKEFDGEFPVGTVFSTRSHLIAFKVNFTAIMKGSEEVRISKAQFMYGKGVSLQGSNSRLRGLLVDMHRGIWPAHRI
jgi:hypothetical protein